MCELTVSDARRSGFGEVEVRCEACGIACAPDGKLAGKIAIAAIRKKLKLADPHQKEVLEEVEDAWKGKTKPQELFPDESSPSKSARTVTKQSVIAGLKRAHSTSKRQSKKFSRGKRVSEDRGGRLMLTLESDR